MNDAQPVRERNVEELRQRFLSHAAAAFDLMFDPTIRTNSSPSTSAKSGPANSAAT